MHPLSRLVVAALVTAPLQSQAGEFAQAPPVPGMALSRPDPGMAGGALAPAPGPAAATAPAPTAVPASAPTPTRADAVAAGERRLRALGSGFPSIDGQLPNQRTGARHQHVVRDICIGC